MKPFVALVLTVLLLAGCAQTNQPADTRSPAQVAGAYMEALKAGDGKAVAALAAPGAKVGTWDFSDKEMVAAHAGRIAYTLGAEQVSGSTATVAVEVKAPDMTRAMVQATADLQGALNTGTLPADAKARNEMLRKALIAALGAAPTVSAAGQVQLEQVRGSWRVKAFKGLEAIVGF